MHPRCVLAASALAAALALAACGSDSSKNTVTGPPPTDTGSLTVTVTTPAGITGGIVVTGPGSYRKTVTATTTLSGLAAGSYTLTASPAWTGDPIVSTLDTASVSASPVTVTANATATTTVTYAPRPGSGQLWIVNQGPGDVADAYASANIQASGTPTPAAVLGGATGHDTTIAAIDTHGDLWIAASTGDSLVEYTPTQLGAGGTLTPAVIVHLADHPHGLAFDSTGNLWVSLNTLGRVAEFDSAAVAAFAGSVTPTPSVTLTVPGAHAQPTGLAFDPSGDLWVADGWNGQVYEFAAGNFTSSAAPSDSVLGLALTSLYEPSSLAFDGSGDLWIANASELVEYSAGQLRARTAPSAPFEIIQVNNVAPCGIAFDNSGDLWITQDSAAVVRLNSSQLTGFGSVTQSPYIRIVMTDHGASAVGLAFDPHPSGTPLAGSRIPRSHTF